MRKCAGGAGSLPGRVQLPKSMSSTAMWPGLLNVLEASKRMVKSWGIRPTVTSPWCHKSSWLPESHHSVLVLEPSFNSTLRSFTSVTVERVKEAVNLKIHIFPLTCSDIFHLDWFVSNLEWPRHDFCKETLLLRFSTVCFLAPWAPKARCHLVQLNPKAVK